MTLFEKIGGRKAIGGLLAIGLGFAVDFFTGRGLSENFMMLMMAVYGTYVAGNSAGKFAGAKQALGAAAVDKGQAERELAQSVDVLAKQYEGVQRQYEEVKAQGERNITAVTQMAESMAKVLGAKKG